MYRSLLILILLVIPLLSIINYNASASPSSNYKWSIMITWEPPKYPIYTFLQHYDLPGLTTSAEIKFNDKILMLYEKKPGNALIVYIVDLETLSPYIDMWSNVSRTDYDDIVLYGDKVIIRSDYPYIIKVDSIGDGTFELRINYTRSLRNPEITGITVYNDKLFMRVVERSDYGSILDILYGYIDLYSNNTQVIFHQLLNVSGSGKYHTWGTTIVYNNTWIDGGVRINMETLEAVDTGPVSWNPFRASMQFISPSHRYIIAASAEGVLDFIDLREWRKWTSSLGELYNFTGISWNIYWLNDTTFLTYLDDGRLFLTTINGVDDLSVEELNVSGPFPDKIYYASGDLLVMSEDELKARLGIIRNNTVYDGCIIHYKYPDVLMKAVISGDKLFLLYAVSGLVDTPLLLLYSYSGIDGQPPYVYRVIVEASDQGGGDYMVKYKLYYANPPGNPVNTDLEVHYYSHNGSEIYRGPMTSPETGENTIYASDIIPKDLLLATEKIVIDIGLDEGYYPDTHYPMLQYHKQVIVETTFNETTNATTTLPTTTGTSTTMTPGTSTPTQTQTLTNTPTGTTGSVSSSSTTASTAGATNPSGGGFNATVLVVVVVILVLAGIAFYMFKK